MKNQENLEGIVLKLKEQGIKAGESEKKRLINSANEEVKKMLADAEMQSKSIIENANNEAAQIEKNSQAAIAQASRDMVEATKIALTNHLKKVFGKECESLFDQEKYLQSLLKIVLESISGNKTAEVAPEQVKKMQSFIAKEAFKDKVDIKPLAKSESKISVSCDDKDGIQFVITSKDVEDGLFSLLNKELVERIKNTEEA